MRRATLVAPAAVMTALLACQPDPTTESDPLAPATPYPSAGSGSVVERAPFRFFFLQDFDRDISATVGLVSPVTDLGTDPDCGGSGPEVYDGRAIEMILENPAGAFHLYDHVHKGTFVLYEGATGDVCELASHPVIARGPVNFKFNLLQSPDGTTRFLFQITGMLELTSGGRAHLVSTANFVFDSEGNLTIHVDRFELKPIGH